MQILVASINSTEKALIKIFHLISTDITQVYLQNDETLKRRAYVNPSNFQSYKKREITITIKTHCTVQQSLKTIRTVQLWKYHTWLRMKSCAVDEECFYQYENIKLNYVQHMLIWWHSSFEKRDLSLNVCENQNEFYERVRFQKINFLQITILKQRLAPYSLQKSISHEVKFVLHGMSVRWL